MAWYKTYVCFKKRGVFKHYIIKAIQFGYKNETIKKNNFLTFCKFSLKTVVIEYSIFYSYKRCLNAFFRFRFN